MAVVIQEVIGHEYNDKYYPTLSGVAQSYNYYPIAYMEPEDGFLGSRRWAWNVRCWWRKLHSAFVRNIQH